MTTSLKFASVFSIAYHREKWNMEPAWKYGHFPSIGKTWNFFGCDAYIGVGRKRRDELIWKWRHPLHCFGLRGLRRHFWPFRSSGADLWFLQAMHRSASCSCCMRLRCSFALRNIRRNSARFWGSLQVHSLGFRWSAGHCTYWQQSCYCSPQPCPGVQLESNKKSTEKSVFFCGQM